MITDPREFVSLLCDSLRFESSDDVLRLTSLFCIDKLGWLPRIRMGEIMEDAKCGVDILFIEIPTAETVIITFNGATQILAPDN